MTLDQPSTGSTDATTTRVDMHCHSTASQVSKLGVQRAVGLPECATPPEEVYELAKRRGMDFVTITDHDTIDGVLEIADRPDVFVSEELTAHFRGEPQAVHVLCYGITPEDHEWLQATAGDVELCAAYLYEREIACALAHPYYTVAAPLTARHRRRLAELFGVWEMRNGARARELNRPAATYVATRDGIGIGGSDDHAGRRHRAHVHGRAGRGTPAEFLAHVRAGRVLRARRAGQRREVGARGDRAGGALARAGAQAGAAAARPDPGAVMTMVQRLLREGDARHGATGGDLAPRRRALPAARVAGRGRARPPRRARADRATCRTTTSATPSLYRRACRLHERKLRAAVDVAVARGHRRGRGARRRRGPVRGLHRGDPLRAGDRLPRQRAGEARRALERRRRRAPARGDPRRRHRLDARRHAHDRGDPPARRPRLRDRGRRHRPRGRPAPVGRRRDRRAVLPRPARSACPACRPPCRRSPTAASTRSTSARPGPAGIAGALLARALGLPLVGSYHTELTAYAGLRSGEQRVAEAMALAVGAFYGACDVVLSPSPASDEALAAIGMPRGAGPALGPRRRHRALRPGAARDPRCSGRAAQRPLRRAHHAREGRRPARRRVPAGARARAAPAPACSPAAAPSRSACASASASTRPSSAGSRARSSRAPTRAPTCSCSRARPTPSAR